MDDVVRRSIWLDVTPYGGLSRAVAASALAAAQGVGSTVLGRVTATPQEEPGLPAGWVRAEIPADAPTSEVTGRTDGAIFAVGATVMVQLDSSGRVVLIHAPLSLPEGAVPVGMGVAGRWLLEHESLIAETEKAVAGAVERLAENERLVAENARRVQAATADAAEAVVQARAAVSAGEAAQARADEVAEQARVDRARVEEVAVQASRVSDVEAKAQNAWNRAVAAGETADAALAAVPDLTAGTWTGSWQQEDHTTKTAAEIRYDGALDISGAYSNAGRMYPAYERNNPQFVVQEGRVMRMTAIVSNADPARDTLVRMDAYWYARDGGSGAMAITEHRVPHGGDHVRLVGTWTARRSGGSVLVLPCITCKGGPLDVHSVTWQDVTDAAEAMAAAQAAQDAASSATTAATRAQATADSRNTITRSTSTPSGSGKTAGDVWWRYGSSSLSGAIIGAWTWDGSRWQPSQIGSEIVASLTADKLRAAVGTIDTGFMNDLVAHRVFTDELYTSRLSVAGGNLFPDPHFDDTNGWPTNEWFRIINAENNSGIANKRYVRIDETSSQRGVYYRSGERGVVLEPGQEYHVKAKVFAGGPGAKSGMGVCVYFRGKNASGSYLYPYVRMAVTGTNGWQTVEADFTYPQTIVTTADIALYAGGTFVSGAYVCVADIQVTKKVGAVLIEDGAVTAEKITASKELSAKFGNYLEVRTDQLKAGSAAIASDLIASTLRGKEIIGSTIRSGTSYSQRLESSTIVSPSIQAGTISAPTINGGNINASHFSGGRMTFNPGSNQTVVNAERLIQYHNGSELGRINWRDLVAPPWCHLAWNGPAGEPKGKNENGLLRADFSQTRRVGNGAYIKGQYVAFPVSGWYLVTVSTAWLYGNADGWGDPTSVASGVYRELGDWIDWYTAPAMTEYLVSGVTTHPSASGLIHLQAGEGITLGWWWYGPGTSWRPNAPRKNWISVRLMTAD